VNESRPFKYEHQMNQRERCSYLKKNSGNYARREGASGGRFGSSKHGSVTGGGKETLKAEGGVLGA